MPDITELDDFKMNLAPMPDDELRKFIIDIVTTRVRKIQPSDGLRFLFELDLQLYALQGELSVSYDGGTHTKHRHTKYHDFFVNRIASGERVLDVGCGIGFLAFDIANRSKALVTGVDLDSNNVRIANSRFKHPGAFFIEADILSLELKEPFDVVILSNVLEHLPDRPDFLKRLVETVKPDRILIRVPVFERDWRVPLKDELGVDYRLDPTHFTEYTLESFAEEMYLADLAIAHQECRWSEIWAEVVPIA
jgi:2-polyprenyl-3-methyl-5-hydroxy-6-metoxy-1,4-benzoquinol methylase